MGRSDVNIGAAFASASSSALCPVPKARERAGADGSGLACPGGRASNLTVGSGSLSGHSVPFDVTFNISALLILV